MKSLEMFSPTIESKIHHFKARIRWVSRRRWLKIRTAWMTASIIKQGGVENRRRASAASQIRIADPDVAAEQEELTELILKEKLRAAPSKPRNLNEIFHLLMESSAGRAAFTKFLESEYSDENMLFYMACEDFRKENLILRKQRMAQEIVETFVEPLSPLEINLSSEIKRQVTKSLSTAHEESSPIPGDIFDHAQQHIFHLMGRDSFPRFINSSHCKEFLL